MLVTDRLHSINISDKKKDGLHDDQANKVLK
jgi:hypothetical protein